MKKILFVNRQAPHGTNSAQEALDVLLMTSTFVQDISVLFLDDGIWQLKKDQDTKDINVKNFAKTFKAFSLYDIEKVFVEKESLERRGLTESDLIVKVDIINSNQVAELMAQQDSILGF